MVLAEAWALELDGSQHCLPDTNASSVERETVVTADPQENFFHDWSPSSPIPAVLSAEHRHSRFSVILEALGFPGGK